MKPTTPAIFAALISSGCLGPSTSPVADVALLLGSQDCRPRDDCSHTFGIVREETAVKTFTLVNYGDAAAVLHGAAIEGDELGTFEVRALPSRIEPNAHVTFNVVAAPSSALPSNATISISWGEPVAIIALQVFATRPPGAELDATCRFGEVPVGATSEPCLVRVINRDAVPMAIRDISLMDATFSVVGAVPLPVFVDPGEAFEVSFVATPGMRGDIIGGISVLVGETQVLQTLFTVTGI